jgi:hypothetical protein
MANFLLVGAVLALLLVWRRTSFRVPLHVRTALSSPSRIATVAGVAVVLITLGYSIGDVLAGRTQVSKSPVQYATRLQGAEAHHHDLVDSGRFWRQVLLQTGAGLTVGATIIALSRLRKNAAPQRA